MELLMSAMLKPGGNDQVAIRAGKVLTPRLASYSPSPGHRIEIRADGTYLITGGRGSLGLEVANWLVERGAKHLILCGRREPSKEAMRQIERMHAAGADVRLMSADVADISEMRQLFEHARKELPPIHGTVHAAGVLDDGILLRQDWPRFRRVLAPKMLGAWNLHVLSQDLPLDFFVLFSSASTLLGAQGQANYSAANAFLDSLAWHRRVSGSPALSINWGPWAQGGMAASLDARSKERLNKMGIEVIRSQDGLAALGTLLESNCTQAAVLNADWSRFARQLDGAAPPAILANLVREIEPQEQRTGSVVARVRASENAVAALQEHVVAEVGRVLGLAATDALDPRQGFSNFGMDSLMAVELKKRLEASLSIRLHTTIAFEYPTVESLTSFLSGKLFPVAQAATAGTAGPEGRILQTAIDEVRRQRTEELEEFINQELRELI
jgi:acyl carrier protein